MDLNSSERTETKPTYRWVMLTLSWLLLMSFGLIHTTLSIIITPVMVDLNLTYSQMGFILGVWQLVYIFIAQPIGVLIDRLGPYKTLLLGAIIMAASAVLRSFAINFETLTVFVALFGTGSSMLSIGVPKLTSMWFVGRERGTATGIYSTGFAIGSIVTLSTTNSVVMPIVGNWRNVFRLYSLIGLLIAMIWLFMGRRSPGLSQSEAMHSVGGKGEQSVRSLFKNRNIWLIVLIGITSFLTSHGLSNWLPKILEQNGMTLTEAGFAVSILNLFGILGSLIIPRLPYFVGSRKLAIAILLFLQGLSILILGISSGLTLWAGIVLDGLTRGFTPLLMVALMDLPEVGSARMGVVGGLYFAIGEIGGFGGPFIMGLLKDVTGTFLAGIIFLVVFCEASIILAALLKIDASPELL